MAQPLPIFVSPVGVKTKVVSQALTRPADTVAYASGDIMATAASGGDSTITFVGCARVAGGGGTIHALTVVDSSAQATRPALDLILYDTAPADQNDNVAWAPSDSELEKVIPGGGIPLGFGIAGSGNLLAVIDGLNIKFKCVAGSKDLIGNLVVRNAYTPTSAEKFTVILGIVQD